MSAVSSNSESCSTSVNVPDQDVSVFNVDEHNRETLAKIQKLAAGGRSLGCFVCRQVSQTVPLEKERVWVSLDLAPLEKKPADGRLHLVMDVNSPEMQKIHRIFDKVVLDWSSLKFCEKPFRNLSHLLTTQSDSELTIEAQPGHHSITCSQPSSINLETGWFRIQIQEGKSDDEIWKTDLLPHLERRLQTLFEKVLFCEKSDWPYDSDYVTGYKEDFFILRGPKRLEVQVETAPVSK